MDPMKRRDFLKVTGIGAAGAATLAAPAIAQSTPEMTTRAIKVACDCDVAGIDALHVAAALHLQAQELVTTEADTKPMFRVAGLKCTSILPKKDIGNIES